ncbi:hypothetical protein NXY00_20470 [Bacteroides sp. BFG-551]|nr:hypothetical protein [Bacteroides sp. BFG-551]
MPLDSNWLLFCATIESFLRKADAPSDTYRISSSLRNTAPCFISYK